MFASLDLLEELLVVNVGVLTSEPDALLLGVELDTLVGSAMNLDVLPLALVIDKPEAVAAVSMLKAMPL